MDLKVLPLQASVKEEEKEKKKIKTLEKYISPQCIRTLKKDTPSIEALKAKQVCTLGIWIIPSMVPRNRRMVSPIYLGSYKPNLSIYIFAKCEQLI